MSYYAMLQMPNGEKQVLWGKEIEKTLRDENAQIGDRISLQRNGYDNVRVEEIVKDKDGKIVLDDNCNPKVEEVMHKCNHWDLTIFEKAQQVPQEQEKQQVKHDLMGQADGSLKENIDSQFRAEQYRDWAYNEANILDKQAVAENNGEPNYAVHNATDDMRSLANKGVATATQNMLPKQTQKLNGLQTAKALYQQRFAKLPKAEQEKVLYAEKIAASMLAFVDNSQHKQEIIENWYKNTAEQMDIENGKSGFVDIQEITTEEITQTEEVWEMDR